MKLTLCVTSSALVITAAVGSPALATAAPPAPPGSAAVPRLVRTARLRPGPLGPDGYLTARSAALSADGHTAVLACVGSRRGAVVLSDAHPDREWRVTARIDAPTAQRTCGEPLALSADGRTLALSVSARFEVRVYARAGSSWALAARLRDPLEAERFGGFADEVALSGDGRTLLVDGYSRMRFGERVHVYALTPTGWRHREVIEAPGEATGFGGGIASSTHGDTLVVAAPWIQTPERARSTAYVYQRRAGRWRVVAELPLPRDRIYDGGVAISADGATVAVSGTGVRVFRRREGQPLERYALDGEFRAPAPPSSPVDLGMPVALAADGRSLVTGAWYRSSHGAARVGRAYRFVRGGHGWRFGGVLDPSVGDRRYGTSVAADATGARVLVAGVAARTAPPAVVADIFDRPRDGGAPH